jgi:hypothetical protein
MDLDPALEAAGIEFLIEASKSRRSGTPNHPEAERRGLKEEA